MPNLGQRKLRRESINTGRRKPKCGQMVFSLNCRGLAGQSSSSFVLGESSNNQGAQDKMRMSLANRVVLASFMFCAVGAD